MPTYNATTKGYGKLWDEAQLRGAREAELTSFARRAIGHRDRYKAVEAVTGCPWYVIAAIHQRESSASFSRHLHEGSPLSGRTKLVPKGRPKGGQPPYSWEESAIDALTVAPHDMRLVGRWSVERMLYEFEKYNGWGYMGRTNSPYVWAGTTVYSSGKYVRDGVFDPTHVDQQLGCAAMVKAIAKQDPDVANRLLDREANPPKDLVNEEKKKASKTGKIVAGTGTATGTGTGATKAATGLPAEAVGIGIGIAVALVLLGAFLWIKAHRDAEVKLNNLWGST